VVAPFIGRSSELSLLRKRLERVVASGAGTALAIRGRRQVGKSRLVQEFCDAAQVPYLYFTATKGLSSGEAARRLAESGPNRLPEAARRGPVVRFLQQFHNLLIYVLLAAALVSFFLDHAVDAVVILGVVFVNAIIGFIQEGRAEQALAAIRGMIDPHCAVLRDGHRITIPAEEVVPGDIVLMQGLTQLVRNWPQVPRSHSAVRSGLLCWPPPQCGEVGDARSGSRSLRLGRWH
jgi:hypothetical protein